MNDFEDFPGMQDSMGRIRDGSKPHRAGRKSPSRRRTPETSSAPADYFFEEDTMGIIRHPGNLDWVDERSSCNRTPREAPYGYSAHFKWREFDKRNPPEGIDAVHSDRMQQWNAEKYRAAFKGKGWIDALSKEKCKNAIRTYYDGKYECIGYAVECNVSNGYPVGLFFLKKVADD
ncbi:hypothetical protein [Salipiger mucosus]|nr:hypothetical protein [Salipiger mucosus]